MRCLIFLLCLAFAGAAAGQNLPPDNTFDVVIDTQSSILRSSTDCRSYTAATTYDVWDTAPAEVLSLPLLWLVRYVRIHNVTDSTTPFTSQYVAVRVGPATNSPVLTTSTGERLFSGGSTQFAVRRPNTKATNAGTWPAGPQPIWILPISTVDLCITYYW